MVGSGAPTPQGAVGPGPAATPSTHDYPATPSIHDYHKSSSKLPEIKTGQQSGCTHRREGGNLKSTKGWWMEKQAKVPGGKVAPEHSLTTWWVPQAGTSSSKRSPASRPLGAREISNLDCRKQLGQMEKHARLYRHPSPSCSPVLQPHESQSDHMRHI